jgi:hypothetical protein
MITKDEYINFYRISLGDVFSVVLVTIAAAFFWAMHILPIVVFLGSNQDLFFVACAKYPWTMLALHAGLFPIVNYILRKGRDRVALRDCLLMLPSLLLILAVVFVYS